MWLLACHLGVMPYYYYVLLPYVVQEARMRLRFFKMLGFFPSSVLKIKAKCYIQTMRRKSAYKHNIITPSLLFLRYILVGVVLVLPPQLRFVPIAYAFSSSAIPCIRRPDYSISTITSSRNSNTGLVGSSSQPCCLRHHTHDGRIKIIPRMINDPENTDTTTSTTSTNSATAGISVWNPLARTIMASLASVGAIETGYLTFVKLTQGSIGLQKLCSVTSSSSSSSVLSSSVLSLDGNTNNCSLVLDSSYATIGGIPLTFYGFLSYTTVVFLALFPLFSTSGPKGDEKAQQLLKMDNNDNKDNSSNSKDLINRISLLSLTTCMATFSIYLMSILIFVLKANCPFCILSAVLSVTLGIISWLGGAAEEEKAKSVVSADTLVSQSAPPPARTTPALFGLSSFVLTTLATALIYGNIYTDLPSTANASSNGAATQQEEVELSPPPIRNTSNQRALLLSTDLQNLNTRFFGAYWCSHCYEQKERLGKEAMSRIPYIECSREGKNSQAALCKSRKIPGYPTWEINNQLFPGERSIEELEDIVSSIKEKSSF